MAIKKPSDNTDLNYTDHHKFIENILIERGLNPNTILNLNNLATFDLVKLSEKDNSLRLKGQFLKGTSGNASGRKPKIPKEERNILDDLITQFEQTSVTAPSNLTDAERLKKLKDDMMRIIETSKGASQMEAMKALMPHIMKLVPDDINKASKQVIHVVIEPETAELLNHVKQNLGV